MGSLCAELNDKAWLQQKYEVERLSARQIASLIKCTGPTVITALRGLGICTRTHFDACSRRDTGRYALLNDIPWLRQKYEVERLSTRKMAKIAKCSNCVIAHALHRGKVKVRSVSEAITGTKCTEATKEKHRKNRKLLKFPKHHTKPELLFEAICIESGLPFEYTGDGKVWIGKKGEHNINPDFICKTNEKRFAVFVNGNFWHSQLLRPQLRETQRPAFQIKQSKRHRWVPIILWETDLKREDAEAFVLSTLKKEGFDISCIDQQQNAK